MTLYPVMMPVPEPEYKLSSKEKVDRLRTIARQALALSAEKSGITLGELKKDQDDIPIPFDGNYWALSHKPKFVAAVISRDIIGIDIEEISPRTPAMFPRLADEAEWGLCGKKDWHKFFRYWTAKEAILKALGVGVSGFRECRVTSITDNCHIVLDYRDRQYQVEQFYYSNHIVSVLQQNDIIEWSVVDEMKHI